MVSRNQVNNNRQPEYRQVFEYQGARIDVVCQEQSDLDWLTGFLHPWFQLVEGDSDARVSLIYDSLQFDELLDSGFLGDLCSAFIQDTNVIDFDGLDIPGYDNALFDQRYQLIVLVKSNRVTLLGRTHDVLARKALMKTVREVLMGYVHETSGRFLHATGCALDNAGLAMAGPRNAGKTSLLLYLLLNSDLQFIAGDRLLIKDGMAIGMPTIVSIRNGTLELNPAFANEINTRGYGLPLTLEECENNRQWCKQYMKADKVLLGSQHLSAILDRKHAAHASLRGLVFPRVEPSATAWSLDRLDSSATRQRLSEALFGNIHPGNRSEAFTLVDSKIAERCILSDNEFIDSLSATIPAYDCVFGVAAFKNRDLAVAIVDTLLITN